MAAAGGDARIYSRSGSFQHLSANVDNLHLCLTSLSVFLPNSLSEEGFLPSGAALIATDAI